MLVGLEAYEALAGLDTIVVWRSADGRMKVWRVRKPDLNWSVAVTCSSTSGVPVCPSCWDLSEAVSGPFPMFGDFSGSALALARRPIAQDGRKSGAGDPVAQDGRKSEAPAQQLRMGGSLGEAPGLKTGRGRVPRRCSTPSCCNCLATRLKAGLVHNPGGMRVEEVAMSFLA
jgi:hypothetical protein